MGVRPGYKRTEVGVFPADWDEQHLSSLVTTRPKNGYSGRSSTNAHGTPTLSLGATTSGSLVLNDETVKRLEETIDPNSDLFLQSGDVLVQRSNTLDLVGTTAVFDGPSGVYVYPDLMMRMRFREDATAHWFWRYANSASGRRFFMAVAAGSSGTMPKISGDRLRRMLVPVPALPEQRAVATALSDVDALLGGLVRFIAKKRDLKQAAMQQLLTGQIRLSGFHGEWDAVEFGEIAAIRNAKVLAGSTPFGTHCVELESIGQGNGRLLGSTDATRLSSKYSFKRGDVLFGRLRAYLRKYWLATCDGICSTEIWPLIPRDERLCTGFLHLLVQTNEFVNSAGVSYGTHMPRSDWAVLKKCPVRMPSLPEQTAIVAVLSDMDAELAALEARRDKTRALKQGMMQELLTGKTRLVPHDAARTEVKA